ncbi:MAG: M3 family metallopeptidase, partial [Asticcacaulis sp.]
MFVRLSLAAILMAGASVPAIAATSAPAAPLEAQANAFLGKSVMTESSAAAIAARCDEAIALATNIRRTLEMRKGPASMKVDFQLYDTLSLVLSDAGNEMYLITQTNTHKDVRDAAEVCVP